MTTTSSPCQFKYIMTSAILTVIVAIVALLEGQRHKLSDPTVTLCTDRFNLLICILLNHIVFFVYAIATIVLIACNLEQVQ